MWIDLTKTIKDGLAAYEGDPKTILKQVKKLENDGYSLYQLSIGMHTGTHLDSPRHMLDEGPMIDEVPIEQLVGRAVVVDASDENLVTQKHPGVDQIRKGDIVLIYGGHSKTLIDDSFARLLVRKQVKILGIDFASPDESPYMVHKLLFARDILILEHLCNLDQLLNKEDIEVIVAPIKIHADGAIARVYAKTTTKVE